MDAKMSWQKIEEKQDINRLKYIAKDIYQGGKKSNFIVEKPGGYSLNQEIKINQKYDITSGVLWNDAMAKTK